MNNNVVIISKVLHPTTLEILAFEITANDGQVYFVAPPGHFLEGMRMCPYPNTLTNDRVVACERVEIARLP